MDIESELFCDGTFSDAREMAIMANKALVLISFDTTTRCKELEKRIQDPHVQGELSLSCIIWSVADEELSSMGSFPHLFELFDCDRPSIRILEPLHLRIFAAFNGLKRPAKLLNALSKYRLRNRPAPVDKPKEPPPKPKIVTVVKVRDQNGKHILHLTNGMSLEQALAEAGFPEYRLFSPRTRSYLDDETPIEQQFDPADKLLYLSRRK